MPNVQPGVVIDDKYRIDRVLGQGGSGIVVAATHVAIGHRVALKLLHDDVSRSEDTLERFRREAQIAATLPPEHVAQVTDVGTLPGGVPYLVMELLHGRDLAAEIAKHAPLPAAVAVDYVLQACVGVADAHAAGLVHRDLKPSNLFLVRLRYGGTLVKVLDFGLSKQAPGAEGAPRRLTRLTTRLGTPNYMAPEQLRSSRDVDAACDQHALGVILFELLTGKRPYEGENPVAVAKAIAHGTPLSVGAVRPSLEAELVAVVDRALAKEPEQRFPSLAEFAEALGPFGSPGAAALAGVIRRALQGETFAVISSMTPSALPRLFSSSGSGSENDAPTSVYQARGVPELPLVFRSPRGVRVRTGLPNLVSSVEDSSSASRLGARGESDATELVPAAAYRELNDRYGFRGPDAPTPPSDPKSEAKPDPKRAGTLPSARRVAAEPEGAEDEVTLARPTTSPPTVVVRQPAVEVRDPPAEPSKNETPISRSRPGFIARPKGRLTRPARRSRPEPPPAPARPPIPRRSDGVSLPILTIVLLVAAGVALVALRLFG